MGTNERMCKEGHEYAEIHTNGCVWWFRDYKSLTAQNNLSTRSPMSSMSPCAVKHNKTRMGACVGKDTNRHEFTRMGVCGGLGITKV